MPRRPAVRLACVPYLLVAVAIAALANIARAADIYVSTTGNDTTGTGAIGSPFATLSRAHQAASAGDTIIFRAGTYTGDVYITKDNLTFESYTGEWAKIQEPTGVSGRDNAMYIGTAANCTVRRLELEGGYFYAIKIDTGPALVEDCIIHGSGRDCVKIPGADNITIRRCEIYDSGLRDPSNAEGIDNVNGDAMLVQDCYIHDIATNGLYPKGGSIGSIIERNLIMRCGQKGISMAQSSGLAFYDTIANPEYYSCRDCIARNNIIVDCEGSGIDLESALRAEVYNNTMINVAKSQQGGMRIASANKGGAAGVVQCRDCTIRNNIIVIFAGSPRPMLFMGNASHTGTLTMSNNRYHKVGGSAVYWWEPTSYSLNLAGWKTTSGTDTNSTEGDPLVNATTFHLDTGSPCIDQAMTIAGYSDDFDLNPRSAPWDIGADETGGTPLPTPPAPGTIGTGGGGNLAPTASASVTGPGTINTVHTLDGTASTDPDSSPAALTYQWAQTGGPATTIANPTTATATFTPTAAGTYQFQLTVSDSLAQSTDTVSIAIVDPANPGGGGGGGGCAIAQNAPNARPLALLLAMLVLVAVRRWRT